MVQYLTNDKGRRKAAIVPIKEWEAIQAKLCEQEVLFGLREGYVEAQEMERKGVKGKPWDAFMKDLRKQVAKNE